MKIGIFDSGLGGLIITHSLTQTLPEYDYVYLGDTARVPYGNRSPAAIYEFTRQAIDYLFEHDCGLVIVACNTASAEALRQLQIEYLPTRHPGKHLLGVLIPAAEAAAAATRTRHIGVIATTATVDSGAFDRELTKLLPDVHVTSVAAPLLVPLIENDGAKWAPPIIGSYLAALSGIDTLILGCTHYPIFKHLMASQMGDGVIIISQDEIIPPKLKSYLEKHSDLRSELSRNRSRKFLVTDLTNQAVQLAARLYGKSVRIELIEL